MPGTELFGMEEKKEINDVLETVHASFGMLNP